MTTEMPIEEQIRSLARRFGAVETKLDAVDDRLGSVETKIDTIDRKVDALAHDVGTLRVQVEDTNRIARLGLEGLEALRESNDKAHAEMRRDYDNQTDLLKSVLVHVRKRVERVEDVTAPKRRRRS